MKERWILQVLLEQIEADPAQQLPVGVGVGVLSFWSVHHGVVAVRGNDRIGTKEALGVGAGRYRVDPPLELAAEHRNAAVAGTEMLEVVDGDRPLPDLGLVVTRLALTFFVDVAARQLGRQHQVAIEPPGRYTLGVLGHMTELEEHGGRVVDRDDPPGHHRPAETVGDFAGLPDRRDLLDVRQHDLDHAHPGTVPAVAERAHLAFPTGIAKASSASISP